ncbi:MAG: hypothetical protein JEY94_11635 [Melioribacteraceae bacterium]|nr:hypothetical protein [Melioribacteraceae bacterium]
MSLLVFVIIAFNSLIFGFLMFSLLYASKRGDEKLQMLTELPRRENVEIK